MKVQIKSTEFHAFMDDIELFHPEVKCKIVNLGDFWDTIEITGIVHLDDEEKINYLVEQHNK